jgi:hypothetical protein
MRPWVVALLGCLGVLLIAGAVALSRHSSSPTTMLAKVEAWMKQGGCVGVTARDMRLPFRPPLQFGVHGDFDNRARRYVTLDCGHDGGYVTYEHFASPRALQQALASSRSIRRTNLCLEGPDAFRADLVSRADPTIVLCRAVHGRFRPRPDPPCHHPGSLSVAQYDRIVAREDAGGPCAFGPARP